MRPWRTATIVASLVAAVELILLLGAGLLLVAKPLSHAIQHHAEATAFAPVKKAPVRAPLPKPQPVGKVKLTRAHTSILVLNGNGRNGAAAAAAGAPSRSRLPHLGDRRRTTA